MATWECANCYHATDDRELAAQHLTECEGVGEYPDELDPYPWRVEVIDRNDMGHIAAREGERLSGPEWVTFWDAETERLIFNPRPGYVQKRNAYGA